MRHFFVFFRHEGVADPQLERDFRRVYQEPSLRYLQLAFFLGGFSVGGFLVIDVLNHAVPAVPGTSTMRALVVLAFFVALAVTTFKREVITRNYTLVVSCSIAFGMLVTAIFPIAVHGNESNADVYWSLGSSLTTATIVIYGFSRLTARNTALIVVCGSLIGLSTAFLVPSFDWHPFIRLTFHLTLVNIAAFSLRETVERRERELFLLARENLSKNVYAQELEAARARAEEGNEVKLRFLANMSHEFRTPMHGVLQTLELAGRTASGELADLVERARRSGQALLSTLNSILEYTRWTQRGLSPASTRVSLSETAEDVVQRHRRGATDRRLDLVLRLDLARSEDLVLVDKVMFQEALDRVLDNAVRFTLAGQIKVGVELKHHATRAYPAALVEVSIADTGIGIPERLHERVYTAFFQADDASNRKVGGTGLGLAIVSRLIDVMGGSIELASTVGEGTTIRMRIPVEICKARPAAIGHRSSAWPPRQLPTDEPLTATVLLVEDNDFNARLTAELLTLMGLTVTRAADGEEAHLQASAMRFDLILMDCQMPNVDGYEATRRIRESERLAESFSVPIVAVTANVWAGDREKCLAAGMDDYLAKPYTSDELRAKLIMWLPIADSPPG